MTYVIALPAFPVGNVPLNVAARVFAHDPAWVRAGIIEGWLPIGVATRNGKQVTDLEQMDAKYGRINFYISPKKLWEETGYIYQGRDCDGEAD